MISMMITSNNANTNIESFFKETSHKIHTQNLMSASPAPSSSKSLLPSSPDSVSTEIISAASTPTAAPTPSLQDYAGTENSFTRTSALSEERRRIWIHGPRPEYKKNSQRYNLPARIIPLLRPNLDIVILPGSHAATREFWDFCKETMGLQEWQALFTSGTVYNMDDDVDDNMVACLRETMLATNCSWTLVPYCVTPNFKRWASMLVQGPGKDLDLEVFGDDLDWVDRFGHKGALHRHMRSLETPSLIESIDPTIRVARGFTCSSVEDLLGAYALLQCERVVVKPIHGAAGEGILFLRSEAELRAYTFPMGDVCLEEHLALDVAPDGVVLSPALHYNEGELVGSDLVDQIMNGTAYMGWRRTVAPAGFQERAREVLRRFMERARPRGPGGVDFLSVGGEPYLSDLNTGRFNGCHGPKLFRLAHAPESELYVWKGRAPKELPCAEFWARCVAAGCAMRPGESSRGVFPLLYLRGRSFMLVALGDDEAHCLRLRAAADACLF